MDYGLPKQVLGLDIRYDFRVIMDIFEVLAMEDLTEKERVLVALSYFYPAFPDLPDYNECIKEMFKFINLGKEEKKQKKQPPQLVSWENDFPYICNAVNRVLGYEVRAVEYDPDTNTGGVHWWTFLGAYMEIGDCYFSHVVSIRSKKAKGKKLDKSEEAFFRENAELINVVNKTSHTDEQWLKSIL